MRRPQPAAVAPQQPERADVDDAALAIYALHGILTALDWLADRHLDDRVYPEQIEATRTRLLLAGRLICERTAERFVSGVLTASSNTARDR